MFKTLAERIKNEKMYLAPSLETFIQTSIVFSRTNIILNPQRLGQNKIN